METTAIYRITHLDSGRQYVGSSGNPINRRYQHFYALSRGSHHNSEMQSEYRANTDFRFDVLEVVPSDQRYDREDFHIANAVNVYNIRTARPGIPKGFRHSPKSKEKMSASRKGRAHSPETRAKMSAAKQGDKHPNWKKSIPKSQRAKMSEAHKMERRYWSPDGKLILVDDLTAFCVEHQLCESVMRMLHNGNYKSNGKTLTQYRGYRSANPALTTTN